MAELGGRERDRLSLGTSGDDLEGAGLSSRGPLRFWAGNLERSGVMSGTGAKDDSVRVGLGSRVLGLEYLARGALVAVSERGLLDKRLAIPPRATNGPDRTGVKRLCLASDESAAELSACAGCC